MEQQQNSPAVNYQALEKERFQQTRAALKAKLKSVSENDLGRDGSLRRVILGFVVGEKYDEGKQELEAHVERKRDYPGFAVRVEKMVRHACELIHAIQTKRSFPGLGSLSLSKQQEINERVLTHFEELKQTLKGIERAEKDIKLHDLRSTATVVQVFAHSVVLITVAAFIMSIRSGMLYSFVIVFDALVDDSVRYIEHFLGAF